MFRSHSNKSSSEDLDDLNGEKVPKSQSYTLNGKKCIVSQKHEE